MPSKQNKNETRALCAKASSAIKDIKYAQVNFLACRLESYLLQILRVVAEPFPSEVLQLLLASPAADTFQHGILTQLRKVP